MGWDVAAIATTVDGKVVMSNIEPTEITRDGAGEIQARLNLALKL